MAYVNLSASVANQILQTISNMQSDETNKVASSFGTTCDLQYKTAGAAFIQLLEEIVWGEHAHLLPQMPAVWLLKSNSVVVTLNPSGTHVRVEIANGGMFRWPPRTDVYALNIKLDAAQFTPNPDLEQNLAEKREQIAEVISRYDTLRRSVRDLLDTYSSLGALVKDHPEIMAIVPEHLKEKLEKKVVRVAKKRDTSTETVAKLTTEFDSELLMATFVAHKILTGAS
jgi:hypothetical protein